MVTSVRRSSATSLSGLNPAAIADVVEVLARHNPRLSKTALAATGRVVAAVTAATARLAADQQRRIVADELELAQAVEVAVAGLVSDTGPRLKPLAVGKPIEVSQGAGLPAPIDLDEGRRRLAAFAEPMRLEDWAGPVAGPAEIEKTFGTKRSTLHDWQRRGAVIGLLKGERKHVFPLAQFVDGRPVEGMAQVTRIIANPRVAWQWLIRRKAEMGATPLDLMKSDRLDEVLAAAERDFG
ncbi:hypothetical protein PCC82_24745 (plasmid) [Agrobacterium deltaense]|uniref:antitoxin Xre/MbcA/ParS-like domain-containing protein n=1 Tax=Rhizobium/Agrobacterium group TaxID=227290 RepID=UPI0015740253|nr:MULTISPECIES: hypothetical protein [Rhizobium/Agrobacterium group]MDH0117682.1 hypothetical protein [Agrobacterium pusense]MDH1271466.1 hypothetical protein [Agrobacterium pusense]NTA14071.1 hypothetical protein [Agrobacterium tumefaciens]QSZ60775.1 hypothetical protein BTN45_26725 [Rhizobium sp. ZX09]